MKKNKRQKKEQCEYDSDCNRGNSCSKMACGGAVYGLGFIGACVYYIANATGFWMGVLGVLKAIVWPAMLVFKLLGA